VDDPLFTRYSGNDSYVVVPVGNLDPWSTGSTTSSCDPKASDNVVISGMLSSVILFLGLFGQYAVSGKECRRVHSDCRGYISSPGSGDGDQR
jgi:hypothetical protein